ncbi:MAG: hypothetical protein KF870_08645, partial [Leadbetterella sp.]|nr:hypothetical protein [Leadbetterella sp.]
MKLHSLTTKVFSLWLFAYSVSAQETISFGLSGSYNFPLETISIGTRANIPFGTAFAVSPQVKYAPAFNDIHEFSAGVNLHYYFIRPSGQYRHASESHKPAV